MADSVLLEKKSGIATILFNESESLNALSTSVKEGLMKALVESEKDSAVKVIILAGKGRAFCAGGDIRTMGNGATTIQTKQRLDGVKKLIQMIYQLKKPIIAAVHGYAVGAGFSIALATDIIIAEKESKFGLAFKDLGVIPDCGGHHFLSKVAGPWKAKEWIWTGAMITAAEGERYGFVNRLVDKGEALDKAKVLASELSEGPVQAFGVTKSIINRSVNQDLDDILELEGFGQSILFQTRDHQEGVKAFREKRPPQFTGE